MLKLMRLFLTYVTVTVFQDTLQPVPQVASTFRCKSHPKSAAIPCVTCGFFCGSCCVSVVKIHNKSARSLTCSRFQFFFIFCVDLFFCYMWIGFSKTHPHILHCNLVHICTRKSRQQICNV